MESSPVSSPEDVSRREVSLVPQSTLSLHPYPAASSGYDVDCLLVGGPRGALTSAIACGILISVFEGVGVLVSRVFNEGTRPQLPPRKFTCHIPYSPSLTVSFAIVLNSRLFAVPENIQPH